MQRPVLRATLTMIGSIIGAGIFGVPYVFARSGIVIGLLYIVPLAAMATLLHALYVRVAVATPGKHRLVGYVRRYLGPRSAYLAGITTLFEFIGALLAYLILGGGFLHILFGGSAFFWTFIFFAGAAVLVSFPFERVERVQALLVWALLGVAALLMGSVLPHVQLAEFTRFDISQWFLPYGVIFFSLGGASAVPEIVDLLKKDAGAAVRSTSTGTVVAAVITACFGVLIAGATGAGTTENAIIGLTPVVGRSVVVLGAVFGFCAVTSCFITVAENLKEQFMYDFHIPPRFAWAITLGAPCVIYLLGARSLIGVIGFIGAVLGVLNAIMIVRMFLKLRKPHLHFPGSITLRRSVPFIIVLCVIGLLAEGMHLLR